MEKYTKYTCTEYGHYKVLEANRTATKLTCTDHTAILGMTASSCLITDCTLSKIDQHYSCRACYSEYCPIPFTIETIEYTISCGESSQCI